MNKDTKIVDHILEFTRVDLRFWQQSSRPSPGQSTGEHDHPFWQIELIRKGPIDLLLEDGSHRLQRGDIGVLPPGTPHTFRYTGPSNDWLTLKFYLSPEGLSAGSAGVWHRVDGPLAGIRDALFMMPFSGPRASQEQSLACRTAERLILALLAWGPFREQHLRDKKPPLVEAVEQRLVEASGREVRIQQLARELALSANHLSTQFRRLTGRPLKTFIDECRAAEARNQLLYSDHRISQIAAQMEFRDVYSFSRFVRRNLGESPRAIRRTMA